VNQHLLRSVRDSLDGEHEWEFRCECSEVSCDEFVFLTLDAFIELRDAGGEVLADGHRPNHVGRARRIRSEAEALRRQAIHQVKRAKRLLRDRS
jgi:hypothetical protein